MIRRPPRSPLFPYPPLFRSGVSRVRPPVVLSLSHNDFGLADSIPDHRLVVGPGRAEALAHLQRECEQSLRSEEHTSELQSPCNLVCRLLLEKKKECNLTQSS